MIFGGDRVGISPKNGIVQTRDRGQPASVKKKRNRDESDHANPSHERSFALLLNLTHAKTPKTLLDAPSYRRIGLKKLCPHFGGGFSFVYFPQTRPKPGLILLKKNPSSSQEKRY
jgi:hypothetical protein